jgi:hypothetical protein
MDGECEATVGERSFCVFSERESIGNLKKVDGKRARFPKSKSDTNGFDSYLKSHIEERREIRESPSLL